MSITIILNRRHIIAHNVAATYRHDRVTQEKRTSNKKKLLSLIKKILVIEIVELLKVRRQSIG